MDSDVHLVGTNLTPIIQTGEFQHKSAHDARVYLQCTRPVTTLTKTEHTDTSRTAVAVDGWNVDILGNPPWITVAPSNIKSLLAKPDGDHKCFISYTTVWWLSINHNPHGIQITERRRQRFSPSSQRDWFRQCDRADLDGDRGRVVPELTVPHRFSSPQWTASNLASVVWISSRNPRCGVREFLPTRFRASAV